MNRFVFFAAASLLVGCSPPSERAEDGSGPRVETGAEGVLGLDQLVIARALTALEVEGPPAPAGTAIEPGRPLRLRPAERFEAEPADLLELELSGLVAPGGIEVRWSPATSPTSAPSRRSASGRDAVGHPLQRLRIPLGGASDWRGPIEGLELRYSGPRSTVPTLRAARIVRVEVDPDLLARTRGRRFQVELEHELREASILAAGTIWSDELRSSGAARLRITSGTMAGAPPELEVRVEHLSRSGVAVGRSSKRIERAPGAGAWTEWVLPLDAPDGSHRIRVEIEPRLDAGDRTTLVAIAGIEVLGSPVSGSARSNVILVSVDTLRADRVGSYSGRSDLTPRIDAWSRLGAMQFDSAWSAAASTLPSHASMLTGVDPLRHGAYLEVPLEASALTLAERLAAADYDTVAFTGGGYLHPHYGLAQGFRRYRYWPRPPGGRSSDLASSVDAALDYLAGERDRPFLMFLHTYDVHGPYRRRAPAVAGSFRVEPRSRGAVADQGYFDGNRWPLVIDSGLRRDLEREEIPLVSELYDHGVRAVDAELGRLLDGLRDLGLEQSTAVLITSDHGESLGEEDFWGHGYLWSTNLRVPLLVRVPGRTRGGERSAEPVSLYDLLPTILELAGEEAPADLDGRSLLPRLDGTRTAAVESSGRVLWAYAPDTNHGVAAVAGGGKLLVADSPFPGSPSAEAWLDLEDRPAAPNGGPPDLRGDLRRKTFARIAAASGGIQLRLENRGGAPVRMVLRSASLRPNSVKRVSPPDLEVRFVEPGGVEVVLPPGADWTLRIHGQEPNLEAEIEALKPVAARGRLVASAAELCAGARQAVWSPGATVAVVVSARRAGECATTGSAAPTRELREQLLGLGYLN